MKDIEQKNLTESVSVHSSEATSASAQFENTTQQLTQDLSLKQISQVLIQNWPLFLILFCTFSLASMAIYSFKVPFVSTASVIVNDSQNSSLQSFTQNFTGTASMKLNEAKKSNSPMQKYLEYLKTTEFFTKLINKIETKDSSETQISVSEKIGQQIFKKEILKSKDFKSMSADEQIVIFKSLESLLNYKIATDYELEISVASRSKELSLFLTNTALSVIAEELQRRESTELVKIQEFLRNQKASIDKELTDLNKKLADFQNKPENLISLSSKEKVGEYISELMVRKNEVRMKIAENNKVISALKPSTQKRESQLYGNGGRVQAIQLENEMLHSKLGDIQTAIDRVTAQAKGMPAAGLVYDDIKKKSEIEMGKYKEVSESLSKTEAYQLALTNKFEILEKARIEKVKPLVSLLTLILVSFVLSQILGSLIIYVTTIWDSSLVTAQSTRNVVVIDSHTLDPRVIIENSKIKFRLRHAEFDSAKISNEETHNKKIGFDLMKKAEGDDQASEG
jgi:hypothetical protein